MCVLPFVSIAKRGSSAHVWAWGVVVGGRGHRPLLHIDGRPNLLRSLSCNVQSLNDCLSRRQASGYYSCCWMRASPGS